MSDDVCSLPAATAVPGVPRPADAVTVECVYADATVCDQVADGLADHECLDVRQTTDSSTALERLNETDCVVTDGDLGVALLEGSRERTETVPTVFYTDAPVAPLLEGTPEGAWVDVVRPSESEDSMTLLAHRLTTLADHRRAADAVARASAAADAATDGIAVVGPAGTIDFANAQFARLFGYERDELAGRPWRDLFTEETTAQIESDALSAVDDGWQWIGTCQGRRADGESATLRTRVTEGADGSVVLAVFQQADDALA